MEKNIDAKHGPWGPGFNTTLSIFMVSPGVEVPEPPPLPRVGGVFSQVSSPFCHAKFDVVHLMVHNGCSLQELSVSVIKDTEAISFHVVQKSQNPEEV